MNTLGGFVCGFLLAIFTALVIQSVCPEATALYNKGVHKMELEAFEWGYMEKTITEDDKVLYKWVEKP